jgi:DNA-binding transcriptional LysR family regulator
LLEAGIVELGAQGHGVSSSVGWCGDKYRPGVAACKSVIGEVAIAKRDGGILRGMRLDPVSLRLFVTVVEEGSIAAAAEREHIAAAAVSKRMAELEDLLKTRLLTRSNKGVEATAAGSALRNMARAALHELENIQVSMKEFASGVRGRVRVYANISNITQFLPASIKSFLAKHPDVQIHLEEKISVQMPRQLLENEADVCVFTEGVPTPGLEVFPYRSDRLVVITPERHPLARRKAVTIAETLDYDYVGLHTGSLIITWAMRAAAQVNRTLRIRVQVTSYDALCIMVSHELGIGLLPEAVVAPFLKPLKLHMVRLNESWAERRFVIGVRSYAGLPAAAKLFVDHLRRGG